MTTRNSLFHAIVVVGATVGAAGCGSSTPVPDAKVAADAKVADAGHPIDATTDAVPSDAAVDAMVIIL